MALPSGCSVTYDLRVVEILRDLLRPKSGMEDLEAQYRDFRLRNGRRPTAAEIAGKGFDPGRNGHGGWYDFVRDMGDPVDAAAQTRVSALLRQIESDRALNGAAISALGTLMTLKSAPEEGLACAMNSAARSALPPRWTKASWSACAALRATLTTATP